MEKSLQNCVVFIVLGSSLLLVGCDEQDIALFQSEGGAKIGNPCDAIEYKAFFKSILGSYEAKAKATSMTPNTDGTFIAEKNYKIVIFSDGISFVNSELGTKTFQFNSESSNAGLDSFQLLADTSTSSVGHVAKAKFNHKQEPGLLAQTVIDRACFPYDNSLKVSFYPHYSGAHSADGKWEFILEADTAQMPPSSPGSGGEIAGEF